MLDWLFYRRSRLLTNHELLGVWGEKKSERFLKQKGFRLLTRNFRCKTGEIDLIFVDTEGALVFVEVKTRADEDFETAESAVTQAKRTRMSKAARYFLSTNNIKDRPSRFDVVTVVLGKTGPAQITHYQNAFFP